MMEPVAWRYEIKYGPEGEANYAWLYKGGEMVATMKTHHAVTLSSAQSAIAERDAKIAELERKLRAETFRADTNDKFLKDHFEASTAKSVEIQNLKAYIAKTAKDVAETIDQIRKRDVSVEQRARAEAAEALLKEVKAKAEAMIIPDEKLSRDLIKYAVQRGRNLAARAIHDKIGGKG